MIWWHKLVGHTVQSELRVNYFPLCERGITYRCSCGTVWVK